MVLSPKPASSSRIPHHRVDALWDANARKYRVACGSVHVTRATLAIGYSQLAIIAMFTMCLLLLYAQALHGALPDDHWIAIAGGRYLSSLVMAVAFQLTLVLLLLYGIRMEKRSFLLPFMVFATLAVFLAFAQVFYDTTYARQYGVQLASHVIGMVVHVWCVMVVWRCYCYFGDKKVAEQIGEQLHATSLAFSFDYSHPPPYPASSAATASLVDPIEKRPLTIA